jgi:hypothetical protein
MEENKVISGFKAIALSSIEPPKIYEQRGKDWMSFGKDNQYPSTILNLYQTSAMHATAIDSTNQAIKGEGIALNGTTVVNGLGETLDEVWDKVTLDFTIFNGIALNVIWNKAGSAIAEIYHLPFSKVRSGKQDEMDRVSEYFYSKDWKDQRKYKPVAYKAFSTEDNRGENANQIYYAFEYTPANDVYPLPSYQAALNDIDLDARVSRYHTSNISSGISPSLHIAFKNGTPESKKREEIYRDIEASFAGESNAGKAFVTFSGVDDVPEVTPITSSNDAYYVVLSERITTRILTAHRITSPLLLGIRDTSSGFSSNKDEILVAWAHFMGTVVSPKQKTVLGYMQKIWSEMGNTEPLQVIPTKIILTDETIQTDTTQTDITTPIA